MATQATAFRTCPVTGFRVHLPAQKLVIVNAVAGVLALTVGGILALLIGLTRWQAVHLLPADLYYRFVSMHGMTMLVFWMVFFEVAGLYFGSTVVLNARLVKPAIGWLAFVLMAVGAVLADVVMLVDKDSAIMFTAYVPMQASPLFYLGVILFAVGALVAVGLFFVTIVAAKVEGRHRGSLPLVTYGLVTAAIIAVFTLLGGAMAFIPTFLWSIGLMAQLDPETYRNLFWAFGHPAQQVNLAAMVAVWYTLATLTTGAKPLNEKLSRFAFLLYILFINLGSVHHLLVDPGLSSPMRIFNTSYAMYLAVVASMVHAFSIPSAVEVAQRAKGYKGLFGWLIHAPWKEPGFAALAVSMVMFGFIGGVTGVLQGMMQLNMLAHNTLMIPGHFHATVVAGTTVAFMGLSYYLVPLMTQKKLVGMAWARWQPYIYGFGLLLLISGMWLSGRMGVPRRSWDVFNFGGAPTFGTDAFNAASGTLALLGIGAIIAVIGGGIFVVIMVSTLLFGKKQQG
ncbi:MAG: cbb3-type cytochrome c oxidase subunit I [Chloroflexi bacterium]|nr:cbb3-type cytochrome c oxidase subunit I [Chloroflexota bacterium]